MSKIEVMTPEQRLEAVKAKYYRDHIPADGREQLLVMHDGTIPAPVSRQDGGDNGEPGVMIIDGYGAVFNRDSLDLGFTERIAPGAFDKTVAEDDILGLFNHDRNMVLGRTSAKTMRLKIDDVGVKYEIDAPNTTVGRDTHESIKRGDIVGSSFSFQTRKDQWEFDDDGETITRTLLDVKMFDLGPVTFAAYPDATTSARDMRSFIEETKTPEPIEPKAKTFNREIASRRLDLAELE